MADFGIAFKVTILGNEGGYNPGVGEAETYMGIDRGANPHWGGWATIDHIKKNNPSISTARMNMLLNTNELLQINIREFFKSGYWDVFCGAQIKDQVLANNLFDCSVNQGPGLARKIMQHACNVIAASVNDPTLLKLDGVIGPRTLDLFNKLSAPALNSEINNERLTSYKHDKQFPQWGKVWERRLKDYPEAA